jgi:3-hydroxyacyl-CoA dehydrogenase/enoyl-CoA hydratase/3-hydroxybutyryl-CoA epimerase/3-hydroxyacyl-CoA dehydrogenase/enoyl-CoA hydratase/3-hydroxybutyryl-CoA epimerase/enoyl-CoA isomerase
VGIVGAGIMGSGIAAAVLRREFPVTLFDANPAALGAGASRALSEAAFDKAAGGATTARTLQLAPRLLAAPGLDALAGCDVVIEAIVENEEAKRALYRELEPRLGPTAILATNTSAISVARLAEGLARPERFLGIHFFNPVRKMPLVEVVRGPRTGDEAVAAAVALAKAAGKSPIVVQDGPGFLVNRVLFPYMNEAVQLLAEGVAPEAIDAAAKAFGMPMGPITLFDVVGLDTALFAGRVMHAAWPERMHESPLLAQLVAAGRLGQKSRAGFFAYDGKSDRGKPDPALGPFLAAVRQAGPTPGREQLVDRLMLPMLAEAVRALEDGVVRDARDVDLGLILGIGFPPFLGGLLFWADQCGLAKLVDRLRALEPLGPRYAPPRRLVELAAAGGTFYGT